MRRDCPWGLRAKCRSGSAPHWLIGASTATGNVFGSRAGGAAQVQRLTRQRRTSLSASAITAVTNFVTARFSTRSHRTTAHGPHTTGSSAGRSVHDPAAVVAGGDTVGQGDVANGQGREVAVRDPCQFGEHEQAPVPAAEHAVRPAMRGQQPQRRLDRRHGLRRRFVGAGDGPAQSASTAGSGPGGAYPVAAWWWSIAVTRTRCVETAAGQPARKSITVAGSAGNASWSVASHQSTNNAQSAAYVCWVRCDSTCARNRFWGGHG